MRFHPRALSTILALGLLGACAQAPVREPLPARPLREPSSAGEPRVDRAKFRAELSKRIARVVEFDELRKWGVENGARIWLAGGTATGLGSYLIDELSRPAKEAADARYGYYDIYRSTQDADIVIDADDAVARKLEAFLHERFGYLEGEKAVWEVRLLRGARGRDEGRKDSLLGEDFRGQNSDSFSTGMIELTDPPAGESRVRDLFDWTAEETRFERDLLAGELTYYRQASHASTLRARAGYNPEVLSAIRAFSKAFQYDARIGDESVPALLAVIEAFDPKAAYGDAAAHSITKNALKLFGHARDVERATNDLDGMGGFRKKLIEFARHRGDRETERLLSREPLRTFPLNTLPPVGTPFAGYVPTGKTAAQLGIDIVAHETRDFLAYENITSSRSGKANLFVSRAKTAGESAFYGDGAYLSVGRSGAYDDSHLNIRYRLRPEAVEGVDFYWVRAQGAARAAEDDFVVVRNGAALQTLDERASEIGFAKLFDLLYHGRFEAADAGVIRRLKLRARSDQNYRREEVRAFGEELLRRLVERPKYELDYRVRLYLELSNDEATKRKLLDVIAKRKKRAYDLGTEILLVHGEFGGLAQAMETLRAHPANEYQPSWFEAFGRRARRIPNLERDLRSAGERLLARLENRPNFRLDAEILAYLRLPAEPAIRERILDLIARSRGVSSRQRLLLVLESGDRGRFFARQNDPEIRKLILDGVYNAHPAFRTYQEYDTLARSVGILLGDPRLDDGLRYEITDLILGWLKGNDGYADGAKLAAAIYPALNASRPHRPSVTSFEKTWLMSYENLGRDIWEDLPIVERPRPYGAFRRFCRQWLGIR